MSKNSLNKSELFFILIGLLIIPMNLTLKSQDEEELRRHSKAVMITHYHDILKSFTGKYRQIFFFTPPEAQAMKGAGKSENQILMSERYLEINSEMYFGKDTLIRKILVGYDGMAEKYRIFQFTNIETFPFIAEGHFDDKMQALVFNGKYPYNELNQASVKIIFQYVSPDEFTYLFYETENNKESKILEIRNFKLGE